MQGQSNPIFVMEPAKKQKMRPEALEEACNYSVMSTSVRKIG
jgi:hypothetical protein